MNVRILNEEDYYRTVYGGWLGKNIGGTLGAPVEGEMKLLSLSYYPVLSDGPLENDDLDLQLVWLHALEQYGARLTSRELGQEWLEHVFFPFDEYGYALTNLRRGLLPPVAGSFGNPFADCMGSPIRSEIWAMAAPGAPHLAARYAYEDAIVDHAGGEGVYGEMFFAAIESAIFLEKDRDKLIRIGMSYIPASSRTAAALRDLLVWHGEGKSWLEARELILERHGSSNFTDAPQNIAFTILGWLYGNDFEDAILKAVNCGYDTDCTAATLGAILGMLAGPDDLPEKWVKPVGDKVVVSPAIKGFPAPKDLDELTRRTIRMGKEILAARNAGIVVHPSLPTEFGAALTTEEEMAAVRALWERDAMTDRRLLPGRSAEPLGLELLIDYGKGGPAIARDQAKTLTLTLRNRSTEAWEGTLGLELPSGWQGTPETAFALAPDQAVAIPFDIRSAARAAASHYELTAAITRLHDDRLWTQLKETIALVPAAEWMISGPGEPQETQAICGGSRIEWAALPDAERDGLYRARTKLHNPSDRPLRLVVAANGPVTASLNGERVIHCAQAEPFMPAYHRAPASQRVELQLPAGSHELEVTAERQGSPLLVYVVPVATADTKTPGPFYAYTDVLLHF